MDPKMAQMAEQIKQNPAMLQSLMNSRDGQALMQMLTQGDGGAALQQALQSALKGDTSAMMGLMNQIRQTSAGAQLVDRLGKAAQK